MIPEKDWKYYLGLSLFIYSFIPICTVELLFLLPFSTSAKASAALVYVGSGEIAFLSAVALLGKPFVDMLKARIKGFFIRKKPVLPPEPIGKTRHLIGVTLFFVSFLPYPIVVGILIFGNPMGRDLHYLVAALLTGDVIFIISLFVLGGEFWERLKKLFEWPGKNPEKICLN
jgi:F0F1-type ATP synthase membrane subunit a